MFSISRAICIFVFCFASSVTDRLVYADDVAGTDFFEKHVRPLLIERCLKCHSEGSETVGGNLLLDSRDGWIRGGDLGQAIKPGDPANSLLFKAVNHSSDELEMPPDGRLSTHEISILKKWISLGAPDPRSGKTLEKKSIDIEGGKQFWAFLPHHDLAIKVPRKTPGFESENELDRFLNRSQSSKKIRPTKLASKAILIRRVTLALTGLLPEPDEVMKFVQNNSPDAYERLVDRLLASPRYGEKWGRHWLDVARYADSNGLDENIAHGNAWRYRDYVIRSFNEDKPYSDFVREQVAGDLMPVDQGGIDSYTTYEKRIATGFLSLGPKVLAEVDEKKMEMDIVDEQVDTVGRAFMAMTFGCARCHDHKFDPIRTEDYYALAGIFKSTRTMEHFKKIARWNEFALATPRQLDIRKNQDLELSQLKKRMEALKKKIKTEAKKTTKEQLNSQLEELTNKAEKISAQLIEIPTAMGVSDAAEPTNVPVHIRGSHLSLGKEIPRGVPLVMENSLGIDSSRSGRQDLAEWMTNGEHPLVARVLVNRVWRWHFGKGIVGSTDNFGQLGDRPTHPELLNWLANRFVADNWSIKRLHRLILMSATYRLASRSNQHNEKIDRENRYFWRFEKQRMEAEALRDAVLQVAGMLDMKMGGSQLHVKNREFLFDHTSKDLTKYDATTRSVYLPVIRNHLYDVFQLFDYSDASVSQSDRSPTTVAPQALFMMNSKLVKNAATGFAQRLESYSKNSGDRLRRAYLIAFGREPTEAELARDKEYLKNAIRLGVGEGKAWQQFCHAMLMSNEFVYRR